MHPRQSYTLRKVFTEAEVRAFLTATGDANPLHVDAAAAAARGGCRQQQQWGSAAVGACSSSNGVGEVSRGHYLQQAVSDMCKPPMALPTVAGATISPVLAKLASWAVAHSVGIRSKSPHSRQNGDCSCLKLRSSNRVCKNWARLGLP